MKIRAQTKRVKGKLRWYLAESYRNKAGKPRTRWLVYLGEPPNPSQKEFIARWNKNPILMDIISRIFSFGIDSIKRDVLITRKNRKWRRNQRIPRLKRRRDLYAALKGCPVPKNSKDPFSQLKREVWVFHQKLKVLEADPRFGPFATWPKDRKLILLLKLAPLFEAMSRARALLAGKSESKIIQPAVQLGREPDNEAPGDRIGKLKERLNVLDEREATIIRSRYGLDDGMIKTLAELGKKFGVTRERVRQIQKIALRKLRCG